MDEATCLQRLTTYAAWTIRNCPSRDPCEGYSEKSGKRAISRQEVTNEVSQDTLVQDEEIIAQIKKLNDEGLSLAEAKNALSRYQLDQLKILLNNVASKDPERVFMWSLAHLEVKVVQRARQCRPEAAKRKGSRRLGDSKDSKYSSAESTTREEPNAVTMTVYLKRVPHKRLDPVQLYAKIQNIELEKLNIYPTPPAPDPQQQIDRDRATDTTEVGLKFLLPPGFDSVTKDSRSGKEDERKESSNTTVQVQPAELIVQHVILEPSPNPFGRLEPDALYFDSGFTNEPRSDPGYRAERLQWEIEDRRGGSEYIDRRRSEAPYERRPMEPNIRSQARSEYIDMILEPSPNPFRRLEPNVLYFDNGFMSEPRSDQRYRAERPQREIEDRRWGSDYVDRRRS